MRPQFRNWHFSAALLLGLMFAATGTAAWTARSAGIPPEPWEATSRLEQHAKYLASKNLTGRGVDTAGIALARDYIAGQFADYGLRPGGDDGGYFQTFDVAVGVKVAEPTTLSFPTRTPLALAKHWVPLGLSTSGKVEGEIVFVGYGVTAKEYGYDDYAGVDVKGKIVLVLRYEPPPKGSDSPFKRFPEYSIHSALRTKANNARDHGAAGMILVDLNHRGSGPELLSTTSSLWRGGRSLVAAHVKREIVEKELAARGISLAALKAKIDGSGNPASTPLTGITAALQVNLQELRERADNVVAVLAGRDSNRPGENIVIGAHYDHLGFGHFGARDGNAAGTIHPGADDNASGTAVLLELARRFSQLSVKPARTIIFVAFSAEELGLHGSRRFVERNGLIASTKAMLNLDMVGRLRADRLTVFGTRSGSSFSQIVLAAAQQQGLSVNESDDVGRSDHLTFYNKKIPVLHFFTGTHEDYHRATDTPEKLNYQGMAKVSDLVMAAAVQIADQEEPIHFDSLPKRPPRESRPEEPGVSTYLGSIPAYGGDGAGVQLEGVMDGSPAALAGMRAGDVIIRLASIQIQTIEDLTAALGVHMPGAEVEIVVLRAGAPVSLNATLGRRASRRGRG